MSLSGEEGPPPFASAVARMPPVSPKHSWRGSSYLKRPRASWLCLGFYPSADLVAVAIGYFVQGVKTNLAVLAEQYMLKDRFSFQPDKVELWHQIAHTPWVIKPLLGFISDTFPICGERRRPYLIASGLTAMLGFLTMGLFANSGGSALLGMCLVELAIAFLDVVVDGIVVERARHEAPEKAGSLQSICWGFQAVGMLSSAAVAGWLISHLGPQLVLAAMSALPLSVVLASARVQEQRTDYRLLSKASSLSSIPIQEDEDDDQHADLKKSDQHASHVSSLALESGRGSVSQDVRMWRGTAGVALEQSAAVFAAFTQPAVLIPATYVFLNQGTSGGESAMFFFYTSHLKLSPELIGTKQFIDGIAALGGVLVYNSFLRNVRMRAILFWVTVACTIASLTQLILVTGANHALGISDKAFVLLDSFVVKGVMRIGFMPVYVLVARVCPQGIEAALYALLMSVSNLGSGAAGLSAAGLIAWLGITATNFSMLWLLLLLLILPNLLSLLTLPYLPRQALGFDKPEVVQQEHQLA